MSAVVECLFSALYDRADAQGQSIQTLINETLRQSLSTNSAPLSVETLRRIIREELHAA